MATDFHALLIQAGAREPRSRRGKWGCPGCGKLRVSVDLDRELYHCWSPGCGFKGNVLTLARQLGQETGSPEWRKKAAMAARWREIEERAEALRHRVYQELGVEFRGKRALYDVVRSRLRESVNEDDLLEQGLTLYSDLLHLNAELLLLDVLPPLELCNFIGAPDDAREKRIAQVVSQDGIFVDGNFHELPPVLSPHSAEVIRGVPMPDATWTPGRVKGVA